MVPKHICIPKCQYIYVITLDKNISVDKFDVLFLTRCPELKNVESYQNTFLYFTFLLSL